MCTIQLLGEWAGPKATQTKKNTNNTNKTRLNTLLGSIWTLNVILSSREGYVGDIAREKFNELKRLTTTDWVRTNLKKEKVKMDAPNLATALKREKTVNYLGVSIMKK